jgi:hypothetical protein
MEKFFQTTIDAPCYALEEQLENLTVRRRKRSDPWSILFLTPHRSYVLLLHHSQRCQQPKAFWDQMFPHGSQQHDDDDGTMDGAIPMGMFVVPQYCEYCGASHTRLCPPSCQRPKLFFQKKRPPFCNQRHEWDAHTEYALPKPPPVAELANIILQNDENNNELMHYPTPTVTTTPRKTHSSSPSNWLQSVEQ